MPRASFWFGSSSSTLSKGATAFAGELYGVNAFDQPGVELGKKLTYGLMGRKGYEEFRAKVK